MAHWGVTVAVFRRPSLRYDLSSRKRMAAKAGTVCCSHSPLQRLCRPSQQPLMVPSCSTPSDAILSTEMVSVMVLSLTWKNGAQNILLGADVREESSFQAPGARIGRSQLSWSMELQDAHLGACEMRRFEKEACSLLRRSKEISRISEPSIPCSLWKSNTRAPGGAWVSTEALAATIYLLDFCACPTSVLLFTVSFVGIME
ncbi:Translocon-associated protein subunit delta [Plecturocebus cupreus]